MVGASKSEDAWAEVGWACVEIWCSVEVWNSLYVSSLGALSRVARKVTHHLLYSPWMSSFRCLDEFLEMVVSPCVVPL